MHLHDKYKKGLFHFDLFILFMAFPIQYGFLFFGIKQFSAAIILIGFFHLFFKNKIVFYLTLSLNKKNIDSVFYSKLKTLKISCFQTIDRVALQSSVLYNFPCISNPNVKHIFVKLNEEQLEVISKKGFFVSLIKKLPFLHSHFDSKKFLFYYPESSFNNFHLFRHVETDEFYLGYHLPISKVDDSSEQVFAKKFLELYILEIHQSGISKADQYFFNHDKTVADFRKEIRKQNLEKILLPHNPDIRIKKKI